jgi:hypothetical protein
VKVDEGSKGGRFGCVMRGVEAIWFSMRAKIFELDVGSND